MSKTGAVEYAESLHKNEKTGQNHDDMVESLNQTNVENYHNDNDVFNNADATQHEVGTKLNLETDKFIFFTLGRLTSDIKVSSEGSDAHLDQFFSD